MIGRSSANLIRRLAPALQAEQVEHREPITAKPPGFSKCRRATMSLAFEPDRST
jgi:hypothetical protein